MWEYRDEHVRIDKPFISTRNYLLEWPIPWIKRERHSPTAFSSYILGKLLTTTATKTTQTINSCKARRDIRASCKRPTTPPVKYCSLLKVNWWPRIIGKVNLLNLIEKERRGKRGKARGWKREKGNRNAGSKIHFHCTDRRCGMCGGGVVENYRKKRSAIILSFPICVPERTHWDAFTAHIKTSETLRAR